MDKISFLHISDIHFENSYEGEFSERLSALSNLSLTDQLFVGLREIMRTHNAIDFVVISGDITQHGTSQEYSKIKEYLNRELDGIPIFIALGNHDNDNFYEGYLGEKNKEGSYYYSKDFNGLRIIALDSRGGKYQSGFIESDQLEWLKNELSSPAEKGSILILHHTPHVSGEEEYLTYQMENPDELNNVLNGSDVKAIFAGHTHKKFVSYLDSIPCYTVESITYGIETFLDRMEISNNTGYNFCIIDEAGVLNVNHIQIVPKEFHKACIMYSEM